MSRNNKVLTTILVVVFILACGFGLSIYIARQQNKKRSEEIHENLKDFGSDVQKSLQGPDATQYFNNVEPIKTGER